MFETVRWHSLFPGRLLPGKLRIIDQSKLPTELVYLELDDLQEIYDAIKQLKVRGAPAIGCAAAFGLAAVGQHSSATAADQFLKEVETHAAYLASSRPTAVNLVWALNRCLQKVRSTAAANSVEVLKEKLVEEAQTILEEDLKLCRNIGTHGAALFKDRKEVSVLTHCNAGALATSDLGTALAPLYVAHERNQKLHVFADETRPLLQGARLTAWELRQAGIDVTLICDNMAGQVMKEGRVDLVIVGADRIAANGDVANKIGTYSVAVLAKHHNIPFYVAAPYSTIDMNLADGSGIPIEQRDPEEVRQGFGCQTAPSDCDIYNPAFDVTPHELVAGLITDRGVLCPPFLNSIFEIMRKASR